MRYNVEAKIFVSGVKNFPEAAGKSAKIGDKRISRKLGGNWIFQALYLEHEVAIDPETC
jgi:hypothetical protein